MSLFLEHSDSVRKTFDDSDNLLNYIAKLRCFGATKSVKVNHTENEISQESALLGTFCKNGTIWKSKFQRSEDIENECVIVTPSFPDKAV